MGGVHSDHLLLLCMFCCDLTCGVAAVDDVQGDQAARARGARTLLRHLRWWASSTVGCGKSVRISRGATGGHARTRSCNIGRLGCPATVLPRRVFNYRGPYPMLQLPAMQRACLPSPPRCQPCAPCLILLNSRNLTL